MMRCLRLNYSKVYNPYLLTLDILFNYVKKITKLHIGHNNGEKAPHKPILLLSIFDLIESGEISTNQIFITESLLGRFWENWVALTDTINFQPRFALPFYHLTFEGFWHLKLRLSIEDVLTSSGSIKSLYSLKRAVNYAFFNDDLFALLMNDDSRAMLRTALLQRYFPEKSHSNLVEINAGQEFDILQESAAKYEVADKVSRDDMLLVRGAIFKRVVPKIYNYTCCVSRTRVVSTRDVQLVDACHIVPISESADDTIGNGLSLTPSMHRAFDRFLFSIDRDYRVVLSLYYREEGHPFLKVFEGQPILLPGDVRYYPAAENLRWHYERFMGVNGGA